MEKRNLSGRYKYARRMTQEGSQQTRCIQDMRSLQKSTSVEREGRIGSELEGLVHLRDEKLRERLYKISYELS